jgi:hypothetical protein
MPKSFNYYPEQDELVKSNPQVHERLKILIVTGNLQNLMEFTERDDISSYEYILYWAIILGKNDIFDEYFEDGFHDSFLKLACDHDNVHAFMKLMLCSYWSDDYLKHDELYYVISSRNISKYKNLGKCLAKILKYYVYCFDDFLAEEDFDDFKHHYIETFFNHKDKKENKKYMKFVIDHTYYLFCEHARIFSKNVLPKIIEYGFCREIRQELFGGTSEGPNIFSYIC